MIQVPDTRGRRRSRSRLSLCPSRSRSRQRVTSRWCRRPQSISARGLRWCRQLNIGRRMGKSGGNAATNTATTPKRNVGNSGLTVFWSLSGWSCVLVNTCRAVPPASPSPLNLSPWRPATVLPRTFSRSGCWQPGRPIRPRSSQYGRAFVHSVHDQLGNVVVDPFEVLQAYARSQAECVRA